jgi:uncharacterized membrane-anchored protein YjiN (DUF445 family)
MNKSLVTNILALLLVIAGYTTANTSLLTIGLFALSGAVTNWLAVHMLFEKVPGLYGSGIIPERFEEFKGAIKRLIMEQFFTEQNIQRFISQSSENLTLDLTPLIKKIDLAPTFDSLVATIQESSFGQMLGMFGGVEALEPLRQPFVDKMTQSITDIAGQPEFTLALHAQLQGSGDNAKLQQSIQLIVEQRLEELTPQMVKQIVQQMIKQHLGWLVVWGGVFGGFIGLLSTLAV